MPRLILSLSIVLSAAPALAQGGTVSCEPEVATLTVDVPTGRCAARAPLAPQPYAPQPYAAQPYAVQPYAAQPDAPQPYNAPQPVYAPQPLYAPQPYYWPQPLAAAQRAGAPPALYRTEERELRGLWITGLALWGVAWVMDWAVTGLSQEPGDLRGVAFVPVVGPWVQLAMGQGSASSEGETLLIADGIAQAAGLAMIVLGAVLKREVRVRERPGLSVVVAPARGGASVGLSGSF
jgi:hypothetical protein